MNVCVPTTALPATAGQWRALTSALPTRLPRWLVWLMLFGAIHWASAGDSLLSAKAFKTYRERYGESAASRLHDWDQVMRSYVDAPQADKLRRVNDFFNTVPWIWDDEHWGKRDYWATPLEMLGTHGGDCEDFAIAKYVSLVKMGVEQEKLRIVYVRAPQLNVPHMVLAYYRSPDAIPLILDNLNPQILSADKRPDLIPVYSFNAAGLWTRAGTGPERRLGGASKLTAWRDVYRRMREEGLVVEF